MAWANFAYSKCVLLECIDITDVCCLNKYYCTLNLDYFMCAFKIRTC